MILRQGNLRRVLLLLLAATASAKASHPFSASRNTHNNLQEATVTFPKSSSHPIPSSTSLIVRGGARRQTTPSNKQVAVQSAISVLLTSIDLFLILCIGQHPRVTKWLTKIGLPSSLGGLPPLLYVSFWILTYAASVVTKLANGGVSISIQQSLLPTETPSPEWYASLKKPSWNPPGWLFPIMWLLVSKPTQFLALRQVFLAAASSSSSSTSSILPKQSIILSLSIYCIHLALGNTWNDVFFGFQRVGLGLAVIGLFWSTLVATAVLFYRVTPTAGYWMLPTVGWVTVASCLNGAIYKLNQPNKKSGRKK